jgi:hypothetical protein
VVQLRTTLPRRLLALWLTGLYVFALVGSFVHRVVVEHVPCADHGELVHVADAGSDSGGHGDDAGDAGGTGDTGDTGDAAHDHDHCVLAALGHAAACPSRAPAFAARPWPPTVIPTTVAPVVTVMWADVARYRLAPKGSPPAAA